MQRDADGCCYRVCCAMTNVLATTYIYAKFICYWLGLSYAGRIPLRPHHMRQKRAVSDFLIWHILVQYF